MSMYKHIRILWRKPKETLKEINKVRILEWRRSDATVRIERPTRLDAARSLGYKAKQGIFVVRQRVLRGGHRRPQLKAGRRSKRYHMNKNLNMSYQTICEGRANRIYPICEVLNSYYLAKDGKYFWYEVIMVDRAHPNMKKDAQLKNITNKKGRVSRGLTSSARKSRRITK